MEKPSCLRTRAGVLQSIHDNLLCPSHVWQSQRNVTRRCHARQEVAQLQAQVVSNLQRDFIVQDTAYHARHKPCLGRRGCPLACTSPGQVSPRGWCSTCCAARRVCLLPVLLVGFAVCVPWPFCRGRRSGWRGVGAPRSVGWARRCRRAGVLLAAACCCRLSGGVSPFAHKGHKAGENTGCRIFFS